MGLTTPHGICGLTGDPPARFGGDHRQADPETGRFPVGLPHPTDAGARMVFTRNAAALVLVGLSKFAH